MKQKIGDQASRFGLGLMRASQINQAADFFTQQFYRQEPMLYKIDKKDLAQTCFSLLNTHPDYTSVIYEKNSGDFLASTHSCDIKKDLETSQDFPESFNPVICLLDKLNSLYFEGIGIDLLQLQEKELYYQVLTGVSPKMRGMGLGEQVTNHNLMIAKIHGFKRTRSDFTGEASWKAGQRVGYKKIFEIDYENILDELDEYKSYWKESSEIFGFRRCVVGSVDLQPLQLTLSNQTKDSER